MKYEIKKILTFLIITLTLAICTLLLFTDLKNPKFKLRQFITGEYQKKLENTIRENFPNYKKQENISSSFNTLIGLKDTNKIYYGKENYLLEKYNSPINTEKRIEELNKLFNQLVHININLILIPSSITINHDKLPFLAPTYSELKTISEVYEKVKINRIDVYETIKENNKRYQMYYYTDDNITTYTAYYIYNQFAIENNIQPNDITAYDIELTNQKFYGSLANKTRNFSYEPDQVYSFSLKGLDITNETINNVQVITNKTQSSNKEIIIIKDQYGDEFIHFLKDHYQKIHVIDVNSKIDIIGYMDLNPNIHTMAIILNINKFDNYKF